MVEERGGPAYYGNLPTGPGTGEIVVERHDLADGDSFPLPIYPSDGATADPSEVFWIVRLGAVDWYMDTEEADLVTVDFTGTTISISDPIVIGGHCWYIEVTVFAVRQAGPTATEKGAWGEVKSMFR